MYDTITPVNSFRLIFNHYFGTNLKLLTDKSYFWFPFINSWSFIPTPENSASKNDSLALKSANNQWIKSLEKYVQNNPNLYDSRVILGWNYYLLNQSSKAFKQYKRAIEIAP